MITGYPIRPYDTVMQYIAKLVANGDMDCEYIIAEGEHSQFEIVKHASACGARVFCGRMLWKRVRNWRASSSRPNSIRVRPRCSRMSGFSGEMASARRSAFSASAGRSSEL